jgi:uncharacterized BrkB/YihY/UPF0761 family membrane protein
MDGAAVIWQEDIENPGIKEVESSIALYFVSYVLVGNIMLLNVVVAVLLDEFLAHVNEEEVGLMLSLLVSPHAVLAFVYSCCPCFCHLMLSS